MAGERSGKQKKGVIPSWLKRRQFLNKRKTIQDRIKVRERVGKLLEKGSENWWRGVETKTWDVG